MVYNPLRLEIQKTNDAPPYLPITLVFKTGDIEVIARRRHLLYFPRKKNLVSVDNNYKGLGP